MGVTGRYEYTSTYGVPQKSIELFLKVFFWISSKRKQILKRVVRKKVLCYCVDAHFFENTFKTTAPNTAPQKSESLITQWQWGFHEKIVRSGADLNRCSSFCRAEPNHSATRPILKKLERKTIQVFKFSKRITAPVQHKHALRFLLKVGCVYLLLL